jgi:hypothetical protein
MVSRLKVRFAKISMALLLSVIALPVSVIAFAVLYANGDSFWAVLWLSVILPAIWLAAIALGIKDAVNRHSWRQTLGVVALLVPTALLVNTMFSPRFSLHQLFTFRPLDVQPPTTGVVLLEKFTVCGQLAHCKPHSVVTEARRFKLTKVPEGCCSLQVVNGRGGEHKVDEFRVALNGKDVNLPIGGALQIARVELSTENEINVRLSGGSDAYIYVFVWYR